MSGEVPLRSRARQARQDLLRDVLDRLWPGPALARVPEAGAVVTAPLRPCRTCRQPVPDGQCPRHPPRGGYRPDRPSVANRAYGGTWRRVVRAVLIAAGYVCAYCGGPATTGDHVVPFSRFGTSLLENAVAACSRCNTSKGNRTLAEWIASGCAPKGVPALLQERQRLGLPV